MKPYYQDSHVTLYLGDCMEIMPQLWEPAIYDLLLTDPPYGIGRDGQNGPEKGYAGCRKGYEFSGWDDKSPSRDCFDLMRRTSCAQIIWGGNYFADRLETARGWLVWDKAQYGLTQSDGELAWSSLDQPLRIFKLGRAVLQSDGPVHPTQKPINLMNWCIKQVPWANNVLDPFCGSGSSVLAAKDIGLKACGIDLSEKYLEIAAKRLSQGVLY